MQVHREDPSQPPPLLRFERRYRGKVETSPGPRGQSSGNGHRELMIVRGGSTPIYDIAPLGSDGHERGGGTL